MAVMNDRTSVVAFYKDEDNVMHCTETYADAKRLIFGCKTAVVAVKNTLYTSSVEVRLENAGQDDEYISVRFWLEDDYNYSFYPDNSFEGGFQEST